jgi:hypothetical protein
VAQPVEEDVAVPAVEPSNEEAMEQPETQVAPRTIRRAIPVPEEEEEMVEEIEILPE